MLSGDDSGRKRVKPQYPHAYSPYCSPYISYVTSLDNLIKQHISCLVIIYFILMACIFDELVIL